VKRFTPMTATPAVSVVMTTFNSAEFLAPAVESILAQTLRDFELIVVDDDSNDGTRERLAGWAKRDPRIRVLLNERNLGQSAGTNRGVALARAPWIALMDHDDLSLPRRFERQLAQAARRPDAVFVTCPYDLADRSGRIRPGSRGIVCDWDLLEWFSLFSNFVGAHGQVLVNAAAFRAVGGYNENLRYAADADLWLRLLNRGPAALVPEPLYVYREAVPGSKTMLQPARYSVDSLNVTASEVHRRCGVQLATGEASELRDFWTRHPEGRFDLGRVDALITRLATTYRPVRPVEGRDGKIRDATARTWLSHALRAAKLHGMAAAAPLLRRSLRAAGIRWPWAAAGFARRLAQVGGQTWRLH